MKKELREWAEKYVPQFNELAQKYNTCYYTQSPLDKVETSPELMVIGINPAGTFGGGVDVKDADTFMKGNPCWSQRFTAEGRMAADWERFLWNIIGMAHPANRLCTDVLKQHRTFLHVHFRLAVLAD